MSAMVIEPPIVNEQHLAVDFGMFQVDLGVRFDFADDDEFANLCARNRELRIERTKEGTVVIMPPTFTKTGHINFRLAAKFGRWMEEHGSGIAFESSTGFTLPNGAVRAPDLSWISAERWTALAPDAAAKFAHICPDFVVEIRSETDRLSLVKLKLAEYIENGAQLGWLIDPIDRCVHVYRPDVEMEVLQDPQTVSGEPVLSGFVLTLGSVWD